jgi:hypothetical protein
LPDPPNRSPKENARFDCREAAKICVFEPPNSAELGASRNSEVVRVRMLTPFSDPKIGEPWRLRAGGYPPRLSGLTAVRGTVSKRRE